MGGSHQADNKLSSLFHNRDQRSRLQDFTSICAYATLSKKKKCIKRKHVAKEPGHLARYPQLYIFGVIELIF